MRHKRWATHILKAKVLEPNPRHLNTSNKANIAFPMSALPQANDAFKDAWSKPMARSSPYPPPLSILPGGTLLRALLITTISSTPMLLKPCLLLLQTLSNPPHAVLDVEKNRPLNWIFKHVFSNHFSAGENNVECRKTLLEMKQLGYKGVILGYAREVLVNEDKIDSPISEEATVKEIEAWKKGTLETVAMVGRGDFVALKLTGIGTKAFYHLKNKLPPSTEMDAAIREVCDLAVSRGARLITDAEQHAVQPGIESWTLDYQRHYNKDGATLYATYQAYLKSTPITLSKHLAIAQHEGFTLGVKMVRGAYMNSDPSHLFWPNKEATDRCYDGIVANLLSQDYGNMLRPTVITPSKPSSNNNVNQDHEEDPEFPNMSLIIATHNLDSIRKAHKLRLEQTQTGSSKIELAYAQLQGMADEVSCELVQSYRSAISSSPTISSTSSFANSENPAEAVGKKEQAEHDLGNSVEAPHAYKLLTWGTTRECMGYLIRRAVENTEAVARTEDSRKAVVGELWRRVWSLGGLLG